MATDFRARMHRALDRLYDAKHLGMYRIKVYRNNGKKDVLVAFPEKTFDYHSEIEDYMDKHYPDCWYSTVRQ